jgi:pentapeptide repeat protein
MTESKPTEDRDEKEQETWYKRTRYQILLFAVGIVLFVIVGALVLDWYIDPQNSTQKKDLVQALGLITAGVAGAVGIFFTWRAQRLSREAQQQNQQNTQAQLDNAQEELRLTRQGQITERFTRAIDQLAARDVERKKNLEMRLGGIYALERIAKESPEDYWPVMEILTAYVREHAPRGSRAEDQSPTPDIQAILTVLGRRIPFSEHDEIGRISLGATDLQRADLQYARLQEARLQEARLQVARLQGANLYGADLKGANLYGANLQGANLQGANLYGANLQGANLQVAFLKGADLKGADLKGANLYGANLQGANLYGANLRGANVTDWQLADALSLQGATMPDGQKYEDWLKDREALGEDAENSSPS